MICVNERLDSFAHHREEEDVARRWWSLPLRCLLPLDTGASYGLLFAGRRGGPAGPDVRDAVLARENATQHLTGDVEFHIRASDWFHHGHERDPRYNNVVLHVVLFCDTATPTRREDGGIVPVCSLLDLPTTTTTFAPSPALWPCQQLFPLLNVDQRSAVLRRAGLLRFERKVEVFVEQLHIAVPTSAFDLYDAVLLPELAEGLGYGRDRAFFRAVGLRLLGTATRLPEPLGHTAAPAPLDAARLRSLSRCISRWGAAGLWQTLRALIEADPEPMECITRLRSSFAALGLSQRRCDILLCNVVFPFALAVALVDNDPGLEQTARELYLAHPGLPSNTITRAMVRQLLLPVEPAGSCQQQGLHHIYQETCREKRCEWCMAGRRPL